MYNTKTVLENYKEKKLYGEGTTQKKDYTLIYMEKKLYGEKLYEKRDYTKIEERLHGKGLHKGETILYKKKTIWRKDYIKK